jgi:hypothetical protein
MLTQWPNKLGYDAPDAEVWIHADGYRVFTVDKVMRVPFTVTQNPETAVAICKEQGLIRADLEEMQPWEAQYLYLNNLPANRELF